MISSKDDELLDTYKRLRNLQKALTGQLVDQLSKKSVLECAKKLGLAKGKVMIFDSPDELPALMDFCLYNYRMGGKNVIERYAQQTSPPPESDEMKVLRLCWIHTFPFLWLSRFTAGVFCFPASGKRRCS